MLLIYITNLTLQELIEDGIADLHCRSDKYLATIIWDEYQERQKQSAEQIRDI